MLLAVPRVLAVAKPVGPAGVVDSLGVASRGRRVAAWAACKAPLPQVSVQVLRREGVAVVLASVAVPKVTPFVTLARVTGP